MPLIYQDSGYFINLEKFCQTNVHTKFSRPIRRNQQLKDSHYVSLISALVAASTTLAVLLNEITGEKLFIVPSKSGNSEIPHSIVRRVSVFQKKKKGKGEVKDRDNTELPEMDIPSLTTTTNSEKLKESNTEPLNWHLESKSAAIRKLINMHRRLSDACQYLCPPQKQPLDTVLGIPKKRKSIKIPMGRSKTIKS